MKTIPLLVILTFFNFYSFASNSNVTFKDDCDHIFMKDGKEINAKIIEVDITVVKYRLCNYPNGPIVTVPKKDIVLVKYANGENVVFRNSKDYSEIPDREKRSEPLAIISMVLGILAFFLPLGLAIFFGVGALITAFISLKRIKENDFLKGRKMGRAGLILGLILLGFTLIGIIGGSY